MSSAPSLVAPSIPSRRSLALSSSVMLSAMLFVRRPWHSGISRLSHSGLQCAIPKLELSPQLHLCGTPYCHNKWSLYFLVTGLISIHWQTQGLLQLKKCFHFFFQLQV